MSDVIVYAPNGPAHLGPGTDADPNAGNIDFVDRFADIDDDDPRLAEKLVWVAGAVGKYPGLRVVTAEERAALEKPLTFTDSEWDDMAARRAGARK
jgi:hypothetical protein